MSVVSSSNSGHQNRTMRTNGNLGETIQTSPDSTSQEDTLSEHTNENASKEEGNELEQDKRCNVPDSQV